MYYFHIKLYKEGENMSNELNCLFNSSKEDISLINKAYEKTREIVRAGDIFYLC